MKHTTNCVAMILALIGVTLLLPASVRSQPADQTHALDQTTVQGTVVSVSPNVLVVRSEQGAYHVFVFDRHVSKPQTIAIGSAVRVMSTPSNEAGVRIATDVVAIASPAEQKEMGPVPLSVRQLEGDLERQAKRYGVGSRAGAGLDPELLLVGVHARMGPFFNRNISFRPNVEFGWGEVTKLVAVNLEGVYRLPFTPRLGRWSAYAGLGPSLVFSHESFERFTGEEDSVDFGDFKFDGGLNILAGMEFRSGAFFEIKTTVYASPHLRLILGYTF